MVHWKHTESGKYVVHYQAFLTLKGKLYNCTVYGIWIIMVYGVWNIMVYGIRNITVYGTWNILHITHTGILEKYSLEPEEIENQNLSSDVFIFTTSFFVTYKPGWLGHVKITKCRCD